MDFKSDLEYATSKLKIEFSFSDYQLKALKSLYDLKDTIAVLLTGSGKSIIFQGFRFLQSVQQTWRPDMFVSQNTSLGTYSDSNTKCYRKPY
ncbi:hypothetical protein DPMN_027604 [Dreissena polymorpha]|uniref:Uncharacterized protein n=1 Tax=Dreissena polymorpha TaxID=45954 RepID=A0A9D4RFP0_DREPO|nr:hypothetical protein DPMN_027604 [Dreissena polymorpha]